MKTKLEIIPRAEHPISRKLLPSTVLKVLTRLNGLGYDAFIVGGCIRDILANKTPKDFDVVTNATPEEVRRAFSNCRLIGRRFRLAHVHFGREIIEVATFRSDEKGEQDDAGQVINHNTYGSIEEDTLRRDFTINALYYNIDGFAIHDYVGAMADIKEGVIRIIGNADERYQEDPVRMLRAVRFSAKLDMRIEKNTETAIARQKHLLQNIPQARLFDEVIKLFMTGYALKAFECLRLHNLFVELFSDTDAILNDFNSTEVQQYRAMIKNALENTDYRVANDQPVTIGFLFSVLLWPVYQRIYQRMMSEGANWYHGIHDAVDEVFYLVSVRLGVPIRFKSMAREIWVMQERLSGDINRRRFESILKSKRFRAAYDFLELRYLSGEADVATQYEFWKLAQEDYPKALAQLKGNKQNKRKKTTRSSKKETEE